MITATIRDIAIIIIAIQSIVIGALIGILIWQVWRLVKTLQTEILPIVEETRETISIVKGTTNFVSENIVQPTAKANGYVAGARRTAEVLGMGMGLLRKNKNDPSKRGA